MCGSGLSFVTVFHIQIPGFSVNRRSDLIMSPTLSTFSIVGVTGFPTRNSSSNCFLVLLRSLCAIEKLTLGIMLGALKVLSTSRTCPLHFRGV